MSDEGDKRKVVLFDMDGTLVPWDTQYLFAGFVIRKHAWRCVFLLVYLICLPFYVLRVVNEEFMKRIFLSYLCGLSAEVVNEYAQEFAQRLADKVVFPELLGVIENYLRDGDDCWLVSASPTFYVEAFANRLGFVHALGTDVELEATMPLCPKLVFGNNKGEKKVCRLREVGVLPENGVLLNAVAYSDSRADLPMLQACGCRVLVNPNAKLKNEFGNGEVQEIRTSLPWRNKVHKILLVLAFVTGVRTL